MSEDGGFCCCCGGKASFYIGNPTTTNQLAKDSKDPADPNLIRYKIKSDPPIIQQQPKLTQPQIRNGDYQNQNEYQKSNDYQN
jgi:hypothetical protein